MANIEVENIPNRNHFNNSYHMNNQLAIQSTNNLQSFLLKHLLKKGNPDKKEITNTRIGEKGSNGVMGGSYSIDSKDYQEFLNLYDRDILKKKNKSEYLTEKQLENNGPLLVDIDLRYEIDGYPKCDSYL